MSSYLYIYLCISPNLYISISISISIESIVYRLWLLRFYGKYGVAKSYLCQSISRIIWVWWKVSVEHQPYWINQSSCKILASGTECLGSIRSTQLTTFAPLDDHWISLKHIEAGTVVALGLSSFCKAHLRCEVLCWYLRVTGRRRLGAPNIYVSE